MFGIGSIETKSYLHYLSRIDIEHHRHDDISEKSGNHNPCEHNSVSILTVSFKKPNTLRKEDIDDEHHRDEIHYLSDSRRDEGEFCLQKCLQHRHYG
jgi:hypothetical protein